MKAKLKSLEPAVKVTSEKDRVLCGELEELVRLNTSGGSDVSRSHSYVQACGSVRTAENPNTV